MAANRKNKICKWKWRQYENTNEKKLVDEKSFSCQHASSDRVDIKVIGENLTSRGTKGRDNDVYTLDNWIRDSILHAIFKNFLPGIEVTVR